MYSALNIFECHSVLVDWCVWFSLVFLCTILYNNLYVLIYTHCQVLDYSNRAAKYEEHYECIGKNTDPEKARIEEELFSYLVCDHSRGHFVLHNVSGYLPQKVVHFIEIMRTTSHSFYLSRYLVVCSCCVLYYMHFFGGSSHGIACSVSDYQGICSFLSLFHSLCS